MGSAGIWRVARQWMVRCALRRRSGSFDDAALYRFACGFNCPAEIVDPELWEHDSAWLAVQGGEGVLPLNACRDGKTTQLDFYNTLKGRTSFALSGPVTENRTLSRADMLGWVQGVCPDGQVEIDPLAYLKVIIE